MIIFYLEKLASQIRFLNGLDLGLWHPIMLAKEGTSVLRETIMSYFFGLETVKILVW